MILGLRRDDYRARLALVLGAWTVALAVAPAAAQAQCNSQKNPAPPPPVPASESNQTFTPDDPYYRTSIGANGCDGKYQGTDSNGSDGIQGQSGAQISGTNSGLRIIGGNSVPEGETNFGASFLSQGGNGGSGGAAGYMLFNRTYAGAGGVGGAGGRITVTFNGNFVADPTTGLAHYGLVAASLGGDGGGGGAAGVGTFGRTGGNGGNGGAGGTVSLIASGSVEAIDYGVWAKSAGGAGHTGRDASTDSDLYDAVGGAGGNGGAAGAASVQWANGTITSSRFGLLATADGGFGGAGGVGINGGTPQGGAGGAGGNGGGASTLFDGGAITVNLTGAGQSPGRAVYASANGGDGGAGGIAGSGVVGTDGGNGGNGGAGGTASATILGTITLNGFSAGDHVSGAGVLVQSNGGAGGAGGNGGSGIIGEAGGGGYAGNGGTATLTLGSATAVGTIKTSGFFADGALVQSVGGGGGDGGNASFNASGGYGGAGGNGGLVTVDAIDGSVIASGRGSSALLAQSVGGGGGAGGDSKGVIGSFISVGGDGGNGGNGGDVTLNLDKGVFASTDKFGGAGILAQSVGGGGGKGGSASSKGISLQLAIGGKGGVGGSSGTVNVTNDALVTSFGDHAAGLQAQSIGGGGGKGGSAFAVSDSILAASVSIGGDGGKGGAAGEVNVVNKGQIVTYGADADGVLIQSVGGGGGSGGAAVAHSAAFFPGGDFPALSVSIALGGSGGVGNTGNTVRLDNAGLILTAGDGAIGVMAQSVGGGGGAGGDSTASSYSAASTSLVVSTAIGGKGGTGGTAGNVNLTNEGTVATLGQDAYGVFAQSVGGGGGVGGAGDTSASSVPETASVNISTSVGGKGGMGGDAGLVNLMNSGAIMTRGDGSDAVFAQSVGGGGGAGGGGVATASGNSLVVAVGVGGAGGAGGNGNAVTLTNSGSIITRGTDSIGVSVQSVGGGGGMGGKGGSTAGGSTFVSNAGDMFKALENGFGIENEKVTKVADGIIQVGEIGEEFKASYDELKGFFTQPDPGDPESGKVKLQIDVGVAVGGQGGAAGDGGTVSATNTGIISTLGAQSDAIFAQSVGGGGGAGGAASAVGSANDDTQVQSAVGVGGKGGSAGNGGNVSVVNGAGGLITTQGDAAFGIYAQSVGGGGGEGSMAGTVAGSLKSLSVNVGGNGAGGGSGGTVDVSAGDGKDDSSIVTDGKNGVGILAESIGGGGGVVKTMTTDAVYNPIINDQGRLGDIHGLSLGFGGTGGGGGAGGNVSVTASSNITTNGLDAHGIVAQSIGGGGGFVVGGQLIEDGSHSGVGGDSGNGGLVTVDLQSDMRIETYGNGAYGILAQSIGGGGGVAGDLSAVKQYQLGTKAGILSNTGNGDTVTVSLNRAEVITNGNYAASIFAQSVGGGGGLLNYNTTGDAQQVRARGTAGGQGTGGAIEISLADRSGVDATGTGSTAIMAQSDGQSSGAISISIDSTSGTSSSGTGGGDAATIRLLGGKGNRIDNAGTIQNTSAQGIAILTDSPGSNTVLTNSGSVTGDIIFNNGAGSVIDNSGTIQGSIDLTGADGSGTIDNTGTIDTHSLKLGSSGILTNAGILDISGTTVGVTTPLQGNFKQAAGGELKVGANFAQGIADKLAVTGNVDLDPKSAILVNVTNWAKGSAVVLTAGGSLSPGLPSATAVSPSAVFSLKTVESGNALSVQTVSMLVPAAASFNANQQGVAAILQQAWNSKAGFVGTQALGTIASTQSYLASLRSLAGTSVGGVVAAKQAASEHFVDDMVNCHTPQGDTMTLVEDSCGWMRVTGSRNSLDDAGGDPGYSQDAVTYQLGGQVEVSPGWFVGGSLGYESSWLDGNGDGARVSGQAVLAGLMLKHQAGPWEFIGAVDGGNSWYKSKREIVVGTVGGEADGSPRVGHAGVHLRAQYLALFGDWYVKPYMTVAAVYRTASGYSESGSSAFNLNVKSSSDTTGSIAPMVELGHADGKANWGTLRGFVGVGASFYINPDWQSQAGFEQAPAGTGFFTATSRLPDAVAKVDLGLDLFTAEGLDARLTYNGRLAPGYSSHAITGRLTYDF